MYTKFVYESGMVKLMMEFNNHFITFFFDSVKEKPMSLFEGAF
jgi:hypothetical protein